VTYHTTPHARASLATAPDTRCSCPCLSWATAAVQLLSMRCPAPTSVVLHGTKLSPVASITSCWCLQRVRDQIAVRSDSIEMFWKSIVLKLVSAEVSDAVPVLLGIPRSRHTTDLQSSLCVGEHAVRRAFWGGGEHKIAV
jgi:hypothetical protein